MTAHFKRDLLGNLVPDIRAAAAIVYNPQTGDVLWEENSHDQRSIASLTKVMTAVTFVADDPDLDAARRRHPRRHATARRRPISAPAS